MTAFELYWLPKDPSFDRAVRTIKEDCGDIAQKLAALRGLAGTRLDFLQINKLDRVLRDTLQSPDYENDSARFIKVALLGSSTVDHLLASIRIGGLRRGLIVECYVAPYGQHWQEVLNTQSGLHRFAPDVVVLAADAHSLAADLPLLEGLEAVARDVDARVEKIGEIWHRLKQDLGATVIQQLALDCTIPLFGSFEMRVPASPTSLLRRFNRSLCDRAAVDEVLILDTEFWANQLGIRQISDRKLWYHAKQEISPAQAPIFGDLLARQLAAIRGLSHKCLVLDLDNTLWGGTIGDDGLEGISLGQGSALGEAFLAFQHYLKRLSERGIVLAVSSKNDSEIAKSAFREHPEMVLQLSDMAAFRANWQDKPSNVRDIARELNLGLDALVFFDDNPVERAMMREALPTVAVPEAPEGVERYPECLADAGYFETVAFTADDAQRTQQVIANRQRKEVEAGVTDIAAFLRDLDMQIEYGPFDGPNLPRIVQLINKTNQFNLTTKRYTETEVRKLMEDEDVATLYVRLRDRFGDNGIISVVIGRFVLNHARRLMEIDTWLMSCRVLGRGVETAVLDLLMETARAHDAVALLGRYRPTDRNGLVCDHYHKLGFSPLTCEQSDTGDLCWLLPLENYEPHQPEQFEIVAAHG